MVAARVVVVVVVVVVAVIVVVVFVQRLVTGHSPLNELDGIQSGDH